VTDDTEFERRVRAALIESSAALDGRTRSKLTAARYAAVEGLRGIDGATSVNGSLRSWAPAGALAMAVLVTVMYIGQRDPGLAAQPSASAAAGDLEMLTDADAYAFSATADTDLEYEFYEWAAASADTEGGLGT
jgi:hypothetical protein